MVTIRNISDKPTMVMGRLLWPGETCRVNPAIVHGIEGVKVLGVSPLDSPQVRDSLTCRFAFAGRFEQSQDELAELATTTGHTVSDLVSDTDYLVAGTRPGKVVQQAATLGVTVISEAEFLEMVKR